MLYKLVICKFQSRFESFYYILLLSLKIHQYFHSRAVFVHTAILSLITDVESIAIPTGMYDKLGNKGGIGITLQVANSSFCFLTAHLSAHQDQMDRRIDEFRKISSEVARQLGKPLRVKQRDKSTHVEQRDDYELSSQLSTTNPLLDAFDFIIWGGDFNFRIHGTRDIVDRLLLHNQHRILVDNDQLSMLLNYDATFRGISEGVPTFRPTYKFDRHSGEKHSLSNTFKLPKANSLRNIFCWTSLSSQMFMIRRVREGYHHGQTEYCTKSILR